ncbi:DAPG hydrolase family protein [Hymenobacter jeollabukensis]|uniref:DAPG hydrolase PhiG domain-containing protein n=1 Tax=Hymenobacter jeollabukensis TaxID=2025313 RepID=A0A5R8WNP8_9BACT|nr:hypothetical protein [Hymenobacter jeollabukensis]TLM91697.1 hypothetical protein FDY95_14130 [Hymenobacter jeollabukensis]
MSWSLLPPRPLAGPLKPLHSAQTTFRRLPRGSFELTIAHDTVRGVTPAMLEWWFRHIGEPMQYQGQQYPRYLVWHPVDHIHWALARPDAHGGAGVGSRFRIVEAFGGDARQLVDSTEDVVKLDSTGIRLVRRVLGVEVFSLEHWFAAGAEGTRYTSRMQVGHESRLGQFVLNPLLQRRVFTARMGYAWLRHNVEEVGNFEQFLPALYATEHAAAARGLVAAGG